MEQERYYITSNKYSLQERQSKTKGKVYDVVLRVITMDGQDKQKWLRGYKTKALANAAYMQFVQECCEFLWTNPKKRKNTAKETLYVGDLAQQYLISLANQNKRSVIYDKDKIMRHFILPKFKDTPIDKLTKEELTLWQDELWRTKNQHTGQYLSYNYLNKIRTQFNTFLTWVQERYSIPNNFANVKKARELVLKVNKNYQGFRWGAFFHGCEKSPSVILLSRNLSFLTYISTILSIESSNDRLRSALFISCGHIG